MISYNKVMNTVKGETTMQISSSDNPREGEWMRRREDKLFGNDSCIGRRHSLVGLKISNCRGKSLTLGDQKIIE